LLYPNYFFFQCTDPNRSYFNLKLIDFYLSWFKCTTYTLIVKHLNNTSIITNIILLYNFIYVSENICGYSIRTHAKLKVELVNRLEKSVLQVQIVNRNNLLNFQVIVNVRNVSVRTSLSTRISWFYVNSSFSVYYGFCNSTEILKCPRISCEC